MIAYLRSLLKKFASRRQEFRLRQITDVGISTRFLPGFSVVASGELGKRLRIGDNNLIQSHFIFESADAGHIEIGDRCHLGGGTKFISRSSIRLGNDVTIAWDCTIYDHNSHSVIWNERCNDTLQELKDLAHCGDPLARKDWSNVKTQPIIIRDKAWLGYGVTVLKGVTIGEGAVIGAMSVVTKDVPPYSVVVGNPARIVRRLEKEPPNE
jgi:acetyltransferase-like isoleucine patch superfamily enzyme